MKEHVGFLLYQCDGCTCFCAISSAMFGSVLDNATLRGPQKIVSRTPVWEPLP